MVVINIKWGRTKKAIEFKDRSLSDIRLEELRAECHKWSGVPLEGLRLISTGAIMKDDKALLSIFGIKPNGEITMMGTSPPAIPAISPQERALVKEIQAQLKDTIELTVERIPNYHREAEDYLQSKPSPITDQIDRFGERVLTPTRKRLQDEHTYLSETLMRALLTLDSKVCEGFETARKERKEAVKETQKLLDGIDEMNDRVKACDRETLAAAAAGRL